MVRRARASYLYGAREPTTRRVPERLVVIHLLSIFATNSKGFVRLLGRDLKDKNYFKKEKKVDTWNGNASTGGNYIVSNKPAVCSLLNIAGISSLLTMY